MNRRGFLFGAVAVPAGITLPPAIAEQLALPPPLAPVGSRLIMPPGESRGAVMRLSDLLDGSALTIVDDDGAVIGELRAQSSTATYGYGPALASYSGAPVLAGPELARLAIIVEGPFCGTKTPLYRRGKNAP